jgi:hypothetical protein
MAFENYEDIRVGDVIECFRVEDTHYFMWPNSLFALVLPKRVLRNADEAARFAQALKGWTGGK